MSTAALFVEAVDTARLLVYANLAWLVLLVLAVVLALFALAAAGWWLARGLWRACRGLSRGLQGPQGVQRQSGSIESATEPHKPAWALREPIEQKDAA